MEKKRYFLTLDKEVTSRVQKTLHERGYPQDALSFFVREQIKKLDYYLRKEEEPLRDLDAFAQGLLFEEQLGKRK